MPVRYEVWNLTARSQNWGQNTVPPHASTMRWSFTVPSGQTMVTRELILTIYRDTAPITPGRIQVWITPQYLPGPFTTLLAKLECRLVALGEDRQQILGLEVFFRAGEAIYGYTYDASAGGTLNLSLAHNSWSW